MNKVLKYLFLFLICFLLLPEAVFAEYSKTYRISAYYSPLPCQSRYVTGSYEGDIRLNGRGTNGADGTEVYPGMIAAPKTYAFGTKMFIPGIGMTTVHDRGGAIVDSNNYSGAYDRLDIWMGYGDAGLNRALNWGKRNVDVVVYGVDHSIPDKVTLPGYSHDEGVVNQCSSEYVPTEMPEVKFSAQTAEFVEEKREELVIIETYGVELDDLFHTGLMKGDSGSEVLKLQKELAHLNFYRSNFTGIFDELTTHALFKFQQSQGIIYTWEDVGSGYFGPQTRARMNELISLRNESKVLIAKANLENPNRFIASELAFGDKSADVKKLQEFLLEEGVYEASFTSNYFGEQTQASVLKFQLKYGIVNSESDLGAGRVGPATLKAINALS